MTTATAKNYATSTIMRGPGDVWINLAVPGAGARLTLHSDGSPDAITNPSAVHLGLTTKGTKVIYKPKIEYSEADEITGYYRSNLTMEDMEIDGEWLQVLDMAILDKMTVGGTRVTASGYDQITVGGKTTVTTYSLAVISPLPEDATKFMVFHLYKGFNEPGFDLEITRKKDGASTFKFKGLTITSRASGDQMGTIFKTT